MDCNFKLLLREIPHILILNPVFVPTNQQFLQFRIEKRANRYHSKNDILLHNNLIYESVNNFVFVHRQLFVTSAYTIDY